MIIQPFDNNPISTTKRTGSFTVPAGEYALVTPLAPDVTLDGNELFLANTITKSGTTTATGQQFVGGVRVGAGQLAIGFLTASSPFGVGMNVRIFSDYREEGAYTSDIIYAEQFNESNTNTGTHTINFSEFIAGSSIVQFKAGQATSTVTYNWEVKLYNKASGSIWVPSGSVLDGSNYITTIYKVAT